jgi:site-specific DNA-methyltransferase (adenine-specific)
MTTSYREVGHSSLTDEWPTPQKIVDSLAKEFGPFTLDPAADPDNAKAPTFFTKDQDGLSQPWYGRVWLNPPYGRTVGQWLQKARREVELGHAQVVVCLIPARVDAHWWKANVEAARPKPLVRFWLRRIQFVRKQDAPFPSAIVVYGRLTGRHGKTAKVCANPKCEQKIFWPAQVNRKTCSDACRLAVWKQSQDEFSKRTNVPVRFEDREPVRFTCDVVFRMDWDLYEALVETAKRNHVSLDEQHDAVVRAGLPDGKARTPAAGGSTSAASGARSWGST